MDPCGDLGPMSVCKAYTDRAGSCNFCTKGSLHVFVVRGHHLEVRFCYACLAKLVKETK